MSDVGLGDNSLKVKKREILARWVFPPLLTKDLLEAKKAIKYQAIAVEEGLRSISSELSKLRNDLLSAIYDVKQTIQMLPEEQIRAQLRFKAYMLAVTDEPEPLARAIYYWENILGETISDPLKGVNTGLILALTQFIDPALTEKERNAILAGETLMNPWDSTMPPDSIVYLALYRVLTLPVSSRTISMEEIYATIKKLDPHTKKQLTSREGISELTRKMRELSLLNHAEYYYIRARTKKWRYQPIAVIAKQLASLIRKPASTTPTRTIDSTTLLTLLLEELEQLEQAITNQELKKTLKQIINKYKKYLPMTKTIEVQET